MILSPTTGLRRRSGDDAGSSLVALSAGVLVFLVFLLFAMQLLIGLHARTSVSTAAFDGARLVATDRIDHSDPTQLRASQQRADEQIRRLLGRSGATARIDWSATTTETVAVRVEVDPPRFLLPGFTSMIDASVDRTVRVRVEELR